LLSKSVYVFLALATRLTAQQPPASDPVSLAHADAQQRAAWATEWLHSDDPLRLAWGAWLAKQDRHKELIPLLNEVVAEYQPNPTTCVSNPAITTTPATPRGSCDDGNRDQYRSQYLATRMANSAPQIKVDLYPYATIAWKGDIDYRPQVLAIVEAQRSLFRHAIAQLQDSGRALTPVETETLQLRIEILVRDDRANKSASLPVLPEQDGSVLVRTNFTKPLD